MVDRCHFIIQAGISQQAGRSKLGEAMGEEPGQIVRIDQLAARITGQPFGTHHRANSVVWMEILGGHMIEPVNVVYRRIAKDLVGCRQAKRMGVIPDRGRRT